MRRDEAIFDALAEFATPAEAVSAFHYHGTIEPFDQAPRPSGYDGCLWLAEAPTVAQCYIPASGSKGLVHVHSFRMNERVRPALVADTRAPTGFYATALALGFPAAVDIRIDRLGDAESWICPPGYPKGADVVSRLVELGYPYVEDRDFQAWVKYGRDAEGRERILPADYRAPGRLYIVEGVRGLKLFDIASGQEGDLMDVDYHKLEVFRKAEAAGYEGIVINDFAQSETHGNMGHRSIGVFAAALPKLSYCETPVVRWDWPDDFSAARVTTTPEFERLHAEAMERRRSADLTP